MLFFGGGDKGKKGKKDLGRGSLGAMGKVLGGIKAKVLVMLASSGAYS